MTQATIGSALLSQPRNIVPGRRSWVVLSIVLIAAFFLPILEQRNTSASMWDEDASEYELRFINIEMLSWNEGLPIVGRFLVVYPVVAGIVILIAASLAPNIVRAGAATGLGILLYMPMLSGWDNEGGRAIEWLFPDVANRIMLIYAIVSLGLTGMLAGSLARRYRPLSNLAAIVGITGGVLFLAGMLLPALPEHVGHVLFAAPFKLFAAESNMATAIGLCIVLAMVAWLISAILCFTNVPRRAAESAQAIGAGAFRAFLAGAILLFAAVVIPVCSEYHDASTFYVILLVVVKIASWVTGSFLILPLGVAGLIAAVQDRSVGMVTAGLSTLESSSSRLQELRRLQEQGLVSQEEYEEQRKRIISSL